MFLPSLQLNSQGGVFVTQVALPIWQLPIWHGKPDSRKVCRISKFMTYFSYIVPVRRHGVRFPVCLCLCLCPCLCLESLTRRHGVPVPDTKTADREADRGICPRVRVRVRRQAVSDFAACHAVSVCLSLSPLVWNDSDGVTRCHAVSVCLRFPVCPLSRSLTRCQNDSDGLTRCPRDDAETETA